jgi:hypothetical protein
MWQFATLEPTGESPSADLLRSQFKLHTDEPAMLGMIEHALTHRRYRFHAFACESRDAAHGIWATLAELEDRPMPKPHLRIRRMLEAEKQHGRDARDAHGTF